MGTGAIFLGGVFAESGEEGLEVVGQRAREERFLAGFGMHEAKLGRMQHHPAGPRGIGDPSASQGRGVDPFAADRMAGLRKMNPNLVRAAGLQPTFHEREGVAKVLQRLHVCHRQLAPALPTAAPTAVAAIANEFAADRAGGHPSHADRKVATVSRVGAELLGEDSSGRHTAGKDDQPARLTVDAMHAAYRSHPS